MMNLLPLEIRLTRAFYITGFNNNKPTYGYAAFIKSLVLSILFDLTHLHLTTNPVTVISLCMYLAIELNVCFQKQALLPANIHYKHLSLSLLFCLGVIWSFEMSYFLLQDSLKFTS